MQPKSKQFHLPAIGCLRFTRYRVCGRSQLPAGQVLTILLHFRSSPSVRTRVGRPWRISWHPNQQNGSPVGEPPRGNQRLTTEVDPIACFRGLWEAASRLVRPSCSPTSILSFAPATTYGWSRHALLISQSMIVLAFNDTLGFQGPIGNHMPTNCTVSIQMKIESFLLSRLVSGPRCKSLRPGPSLKHGFICWATKCKPGPGGLPFMNPLVTFPM